MSTELARVDPTDLTTAEVEAQALAALEAVDNVTTADEAEELLRRVTAYQQVVKLAQIGRDQERRWSAIRLMAERKMGELLGPAENHGPSTVSRTNSSAERVAQHEARKLAAVPEETFTEYIVSADTPTRAGLLRVAAAAVAPPTPEPTPSATERAIRAQRLLIEGISEKARRINDVASHLDFEVLPSLPEEERIEWKQQLATARTTLSRAIAAL